MIFLKFGTPSEFRCTLAKDLYIEVLDSGCILAQANDEILENKLNVQIFVYLFLEAIVF